MAADSVKDNLEGNGPPPKVKRLATLYLKLVEKTYSQISKGVVLKELKLALSMMQRKEVTQWLPDPCCKALKLFDNCLYRIKREHESNHVLHVRNSKFLFKNFHESKDFRLAELAGKFLLDDDLYESKEESLRDPFDI